MHYPETQAAVEAAMQAGEILRQGFGTHFSITSKTFGTQNLVTEYDHRSEKIILELLKARFPASHFLAEESGETGKHASLLWIVDPLDGTVNFAHQIPCFCISIAAAVDGEVISGVIYQPITNELFVGEKRRGAFCNEKRLQVSKVKTLKESLLATGFPYNTSENPKGCIDHFSDILRLGIPIRRLGSAAIDLCYTAAGRYEGYFEVSLAPWDCAAGVLILQEAGGKVTGWDQTPFDLHAYQPMLATNGLIHNALSEVLCKN